MNIDEVLNRLRVIEQTRLYPKLKALHDKVVAELEEWSQKLEEEARREVEQPQPEPWREDIGPSAPGPTAYPRAGAPQKPLYPTRPI